jgi:glycosidase
MLVTPRPSVSNRAIEDPTPKPRARPWWQTGVIYQIYPRSFFDTTGNGIGDLDGIRRKLDYCADVLGVDALWLSPFYPSPQKDFGYDVADYTAVHADYGTLADFDRLLAEAHERGLKVILDFVPNHTSDQHDWFTESRSSKASHKRDWYVWKDPTRDPDGELQPPNNWRSNFGGSAWEWDQETGQYYLHLYFESQPDLNWRHPEVQEAMLDQARFWLERGADGFRIDVAHAIMKDPHFRDNPPNPAPDAAYHKDRGAYDEQLHLYDKGHPDAHGVYRDFRRMLDAYSGESDRIALGEIHIYDLGEWASYYGQKRQDGRRNEMHLPINFQLLKASWTATDVRAVVDALEAKLPAGAWPNYVLGNHDEPRLRTRLGGEPQARQAAVLLLTLRGTPLLYYGDELGLTEVEIPPEEQNDPLGQRIPSLGRDGCRTPMPWSAEGDAAGFSEADAEDLWLPVGEENRKRSVETQRSGNGSILALYCRLLDLRRQTPALHAGRYRPLERGVPEGCFAYVRKHGGQRVAVAINFTSEALTTPLPCSGAVLLSSRLDREGETSGRSLQLRPREAAVARLDES